MIIFVFIASASEDVGSVQDFIIFLYLCLMWIRTVRTQEEFKNLLCNHSGGNLFRQSHI